MYRYTACNYNIDAAGDDGSCVYAEGCDECALDADGNPITDGSGSIIDNDADDDGVCNADEIVGCMDETACNYSEIATDDSGACIFAGVDPNENGTVSDCDIVLDLVMVQVILLIMTLLVVPMVNVMMLSLLVVWIKLHVTITFL